MNGVSLISLTTYLYIYICFAYPLLTLIFQLLPHIFLVYLCSVSRAVYCSFHSGNAILIVAPCISSNYLISIPTDAHT